MSCPTTVGRALEGLEAVHDIRMELEHDDFVVTYDASQLGINALLATADESGFPATVVSGIPAEAKKAKEFEISEAPEFFRAALATAKKERKPIVIDFSADWCAPCQQMIRETFPDPKVASLLERFVFLTIDTDTYPALANQFGVVGIPDIRLLSPDGKEARQLLGFRDADDFSSALQSLLDSLESVDAVAGEEIPRQ